MNRDQRLAQLEQLLAEIRREDTTYDGVPSRASVGLPSAYEYRPGAQCLASSLRPTEVLPVTSAIVDAHGRILGYVSSPHPPATPAAIPVVEQSPRIDVVTQRLVGGGILLSGGGVGIAFLLKAAEAAIVPLALIAVVVVSLAYLKLSGKSGRSSGSVNVNIDLTVNQRNG